MRTVLRFAEFVMLATLVAGCAAGGGVPQKAGYLPQSQLAGLNAALKTPALLSANNKTGALEYWPIVLHGSSRPIVIAPDLGLNGALNMAANGTTISVAGPDATHVILYDVAAKSETRLADPNGFPFDVAIGKDGSLYVIHAGGQYEANITKFVKGTSQTVEFVCPKLEVVEAVAVDNEGDVFVGAYSKKFPPGVFEVPRGDRSTCSELPLESTNGIAGLTVDPKTGDLLVLDNPDECAGGNEGRLITYKKPYNRNTGRSVILGGNCTGGLRLNADSSMVFYGDTDVSASYSFIRSSSYPGGRHLGTYSGGSPAGFTTIPNSLPN